VTSETQTGPSQDANGTRRVQAAVEPGGPASTAPARPSPSQPRKPARRRTRAKADRSVEVVPAGKLELLLSDTGGLATSALAVRANADRDQVLTLLRELETAGRVRRTVSDARRGGRRSLTRSGSRNERRSWRPGAGRQPEHPTASQFNDVDRPVPRRNVWSPNGPMKVLASATRSRPEHDVKKGAVRSARWSIPSAHACYA
jgi:hypothetical protein